MENPGKETVATRGGARVRTFKLRCFVKIDSVRLKKGQEGMNENGGNNSTSAGETCFMGRRVGNRKVPGAKTTC